jgi:hypothetical protein
MNIRFVRAVVTPSFPLLIAVFASAQNPSTSALPYITAANYGKLPLSFEPNQGQTDTRVQFVARGAGYTIFLSPASATFALRRNTDGASAGVRRRPHGPARSQCGNRHASAGPATRRYQLPDGQRPASGPPIFLLTPRPALGMSIQGSTWSTTAPRANSNTTSFWLRERTRPGFA